MKIQSRRRRITRTLLLAATITLLIEPVAVHAFREGEQVTGVLNFDGGSTNYFDPGEGFVPSGFLNQNGTTVAFGNTAPEFGFAGPGNEANADFTSPATLVLRGAARGTEAPFQMRFTGLVPGSFGSITQLSNSFPDATTSYSASNNIITFTFNGVSTPGAYTAVFAVTSSVPEPAPCKLLLLAGTGLLIRHGVSSYRRWGRR